MGKNINNPALNESAPQFNNAMLDEQKKQIDELKKHNAALADNFNKTYDKLIEKEAMVEALEQTIACRNNEIEELAKKANKYDVLGKQFKHLSDVLHKKNQRIEELRAESSKHLRDKIKVFYENQELEKKVKDALDMMDDAYSSCHIMKNKIDARDARIKELEEQLASITVNNVNAQALKSAESALAYKEKVIADLQDKLKSARANRHNERIYKKQLAEKDKIIEDLGKELAETKKRMEAVMVSTTAKCMKAARESITESFKSYAAKYAKSTLDDLKDKAYESFNKKACDLGFTGSKSGVGIFDRMQSCETTGDVTVIMKTIL